MKYVSIYIIPSIRIGIDRILVREDQIRGKAVYYPSGASVHYTAGQWFSSRWKAIEEYNRLLRKRIQYHTRALQQLANPANDTGYAGCNQE